ncbi:spore germination protein [Paenibacillus macerans]|uniref:spore germination protein n=1 Tax=Paenibacillus macerans TaxID=44252 RepID=UPI003D3136A6
MKSLFSFLNSQERPKHEDGNSRVPASRPLTHSLAFNLQHLEQSIGQSSDVVFRSIGQTEGRLSMALVYISGLVNADKINQEILQPITEHKALKDAEILPETALSRIRNEVLAIGEITECKTFEVLHAMLFEGHTILLIDGSNLALAMDTAGWEKRSITEPSSQGVIRGPKESFTEDLRTGTSLLRRRIKSADLRVEEYKIGQRTQTDIAIVYLNGIAKDEVLGEIRRRLNAINTDAILESNYIEELIQDRSLTPFPTIQNTERPDAVAGGILEGQVGILVDGTPFALQAPSTFFNFFQSSEDYYERFDISSFLRLIRYTSFFVSMLLPALYIGITTFHQEMLPTTLLISLAAQREGVPFPALIEALMMELTFDVLREAGVRMPRAIGPAISIVGALVLGQAAVQAGLVSAAMVIVVSFTAICNFVIPSQTLANSIRLIRFLMMLIAGFLGLYGMMSFLIVLSIHMAGLRSFGVPYLSPVAPLVPRYWKDIFIRAPHWMMKVRPKIAAAEEERRQSTPGSELHDSSHTKPTRK